MTNQVDGNRVVVKVLTSMNIIDAETWFAPFYIKLFSRITFAFMENKKKLAMFPWENQNVTEYGE